MRTWIKRTLIGVFGASMLLGGVAACAHHHHHDRWSEADITKLRERMIDKAGRELSLDEAQKAKLGTVADAIREQRTALIGQAGAAGTDPRAELQAMMAGSQFDRAKAQALIDGKTNAVREKAPAVVSAMAEFFDSLQPAQQQKLRDFMARGGRRFDFNRG